MSPRFLKFVLVICSFLLVPAIVSAIEVTINSATYIGGNCTTDLTIQINIDISDATDDFPGGFDADNVGFVVRDGDCTVIMDGNFFLEDGNDDFEITADFTSRLPPPASGPFILSMHDLVGPDFIIGEEQLMIPPVAIFNIDHTTLATCATLPTVANPNCPFATASVVPTLGQWAVIVLGLILMIFSIVAVRNLSKVSIDS